MAEQWSVRWKREGLTAKRKTWSGPKAALRFAALLGPEPWKADGKGPDDPACDCYGRGYGSEGPCCERAEFATQREWHEHARAPFPPLEYVRIETRTVGKWAPAPAVERAKPDDHREGSQ